MKITRHDAQAQAHTRTVLMPLRLNQEEEDGKRRRRKKNEQL